MNLQHSIRGSSGEREGERVARGDTAAKRKAEERWALVFLVIAAVTIVNGWVTALVVSGAVWMSVCTFYFREPMRDRHGSLKLAAGLTTFVIVVALVAVVVALNK